MIAALDNGFQEAVAIVADAAASAARLNTIMGYRTIASGPAPEGLLGLLGLDSGEGWEQVLIGQADCTRGYIRLLSSSVHIARPRRLGAQPWDIGGWFDTAIRSLGPIDGLLDRFVGRDFSSFAPIADFNMGGFEVREVLVHDGDSLCFSIAERIAPPLSGYGHISGQVSNLFNSVIVVQDLGQAKNLFVEALGWSVLVDTALVHADGHNVMGMPPDLACEKPVKLAIVQQQGVMEGSVELIEYPCQGLDFTADGDDMRGWAAMCFPVSDLDSLLHRAADRSCEVSAPLSCHWSPYGTARAASILTPWRARLLFFQPS